MTLVPVYCGNPFCGFRMKSGKPRLIGEVDDQTRTARLQCHSCREIRTYHMKVVEAARVM